MNSHILNVLVSTAVRDFILTHTCLSYCPRLDLPSYLQVVGIPRGATRSSQKRYSGFGEE